MRVDVIDTDGTTILCTYGSSYIGVYKQPKHMYKRSGRRLTYEEAQEIKRYWKAYRRRFKCREDFYEAIVHMFAVKRNTKINPWQVAGALRGRTFGAYHTSSYERFLRLMSDGLPRTYKNIMATLGTENRDIVSNWVARARREGYTIDRTPLIALPPGRRGTNGVKGVPLWEFTLRPKENK